MVGVVVPCFNEESRLDVPAIAAMIADRRRWSFVLVDDGSTDATRTLLEGVGAHDPARVTVMSLERNSGKGEAVRHGMRAALQGGADIVAYLDADLSTPFAELERIVDRLGVEPDLSVVLGARVRRLGADVRRDPVRHVVGRIYGTVASLALKVGVYDTQCGAKAFRRTPLLVEALERPFDERWAFDVELLSRLTRGRGASAWMSIAEEPLLVWHAKPGSKLGPLGGIRATLELLRIGYRHRRGAGCDPRS